MADTTRKVLIAAPLSAAGVCLLEEVAGVEVELAPQLERGELMRRVAEASALVVRGTTKVDAELIAASGRLRIIARAGIGVDNIDVEEATRRRVVVVNAPRGSRVATAEHTIGLMIALARSIPQAHASVKQGKWLRSAFTGSELRGKTIGILGLGNIGTVVAELARALGMRVIAHDPYVRGEKAEKAGATLVSLDELLRRADCVSLHLPLTGETQHLINATLLGRMKRGAWLINCARGEIVDESALVEALAAGHLGGAALDVFASEPLPAGHPLLGFDNVIVTPHLGSRTVEAQAKLSVEVAQGIATFLRGGKVRYAVNVPPLSGVLAGAHAGVERQ